MLLGDHGTPRVKVFREAAAGRRASNVWCTVLQSVVVWGLSLWLGPMLILAMERSASVPGFSFNGQAPLAATLFIAASALNAMAGGFLAVRGRGTPLPLACPRELVISGPYRYVRNPMAIAGIAQGIAVALWLGSWSVLLYAACGALLWHFAIRPAEERDLLARFGSCYDAYRRAVRVWWPHARPYRD